MTTKVRAGALTAVIDNGVVRHLRYGGREVLRRVYFAVRDRQWGTLVPELSNVILHSDGHGFRLAYDAKYSQDEIHFAAQITVEGDAGGRIRWSVEGRALSTFWKNRVGFCVLHPMALAGRRCRVEHSEGPVEQGEFPLNVSPHQPFLDIRSIRHEVEEGVTAEVRLEGDVFEMEDQRNWTDGSYKIYSTPLRVPFPAQMKEGTQVRQTVTLRLLPEGLEPPALEADRIELRVVEENRVPLPAIGLGLPRDEVRTNGVWVERLKALHLKHVRTEVDFRHRDAGKALAAAARAAAASKLPVEAALIVTRHCEAEMREALKVARAWNLNVCRWLVTSAASKAATAEEMLAARRALGTAVPLNAGTNGYFADLNRNRPDPALAGGVCFTANPQVHATDDATLADNAPGAGAAVECAREFAEGKPVHLSPVTLRPASQHGADPRQKSWLAALWTLVNLKHVSRAGAASVTYYETCGDKGVMSRMGEEVYPVWHALREVGELPESDVVWLETSGAPEVDGLALRSGRRTRLLFGNFTQEPRAVRLHCGGLGALIAFRGLDGSDPAVELGEERIDVTLPSHALVRADFEMPLTAEIEEQAAEAVPEEVEAVAEV
jgi:hypothetical protein